MIVARAFRPPRSGTDSCPRPFSRKCRQARSGRSGQRNPSHDPRTFCLHDDFRRSAVRLWLLLLFASRTPVVWPAPRVLQQRRNDGFGRKPGDYRRSDLNGFGTADICRSFGNHLKRPGADECAAAFASAATVSSASATDALSAHQSERNLICLFAQSMP
jgi:hypothetical protein